jgi:hypothetical protein
MAAIISALETVLHYLQFQAGCRFPEFNNTSVPLSSSLNLPHSQIPWQVLGQVRVVVNKALRYF